VSAAASAKLALGQLHQGFVQDAPEQHGVKIGSEVYGYPGSIGPLQIVDEFVALPICDPFCHQRVHSFTSAWIHHLLLCLGVAMKTRRLFGSNEGGKPQGEHQALLTPAEVSAAILRA
jgi:hypothetical protein